MKYINYIIAISFFIYPFAAVPQSSDSFKAVVEVNDQIITNFEINQRTKMLAAFGAQQIKKSEVIESLIDERLYLDVAKKLKVLPTEEDINSELITFAKRGNLNKEDLLEYLKSRNIYKITLTEYLNAGLIRRKVIQNKFVDNIFISQSDIDIALNSNDALSEQKTNKIKFIVLSSQLKDKIKIFTSIKSNINSCLDLQIEAQKYEEVLIEVNNQTKENIPKIILDKLDLLDINESMIIKNFSNDGIALLMLCTRNSKVSDNYLDIIRNEIFNKRINKLGNAYLQELKGEAFINFK